MSDPQLFERAKKTALDTIKTWLPGGKTDNNEYTILNPTRADNKLGSFRINLQTGKWAEFSGHERGGDAISLYAYIFFDRLIGLASAYNNPNKAIQTVAAKEIQEKYDDDYFPKEDDFKIAKSSGGYWAGYYHLSRGTAEKIDFDDNFYATKNGVIENTWDFKRYIGKNDLRTVFKVVRFRSSDGKKQDLPFSLWKNGDVIKWRCKRGFEKGKVPLYNEYLLEDRVNDPFGLFEGQKCGAVAHNSVVNDFYIPIAFYGGAGNFSETDWTPLIGRSGFFWPDGDAPGRRAILSLRDIECNVKIISTPFGKKSGWDIADALEEGLDVMELINGKKEEENYIDDDKFPFRIVGTSNKNIYVYSHEFSQVSEYRKTNLGKAQLLAMMPKKDWGIYFGKDDGGISWDSATDFILRESAKKPIYSDKLVRGTGCWRDDGRIIVNTGKKILCAGEEYKLYEFKSKYVYEKCELMPYRYDNPNDDNGKLLDACKLIPWQNAYSAELLTGWLLLAPFGGCLEWRPHAWIHGLKGSGKSWTMNNLVAEVLKGFCVNMLGSSTAAGVRQEMGKSSLAAVSDEMEKTKKKMIELIDDKLMIARQSSTGSENQGKLLHGTADGSGVGYTYQSMWLAASIGVGTVDGADKDRWTPLGLKNQKSINIKEKEESFLKLQQAVDNLDRDWCLGCHARTLSIIDEVLKAVDIFRNCAAQVIGVKRHGDQSGTMFAGAYMATHDTAPSEVEAAEYLSRFNLKFIFSESDSSDDERQLLDEILSAKIDVIEDYGRNKYPIGKLIRYLWTKTDAEKEDLQVFVNSDKIIKSALSDIGINIAKDNASIAKNHPGMCDILSDTAWKNNYLDILGQLDFCGDISTGSARFGGVNKRYRKMAIGEMLGEEEVGF